jgi:hypothetical protein
MGRVADLLRAGVAQLYTDPDARDAWLRAFDQGVRPFGGQRRGRGAPPRQAGAPADGCARCAAHSDR